MAKTKTAKKTVPKTKASSSPKKKSVKNKEWENLSKELKTLIPKLDEEGLAFLVKQAQVHLYNMQVDALNKTIIKDEKRQKSTPKKKIDTAAGEFADVKTSGSGYFVLYNNDWISFTKDEMTTLVKIVLGEGTDTEIKERLYAWLYRERKDVIVTASIAGKFDKKLESLDSLLRSNFKLKNKQ